MMVAVAGVHVVENVVECHQRHAQQGPDADHGEPRHVGKGRAVRVGLVPPTAQDGRHLAAAVEAQQRWHQVLDAYAGCSCTRPTAESDLSKHKNKNQIERHVCVNFEKLAPCRKVGSGPSQAHRKSP